MSRSRRFGNLTLIDETFDPMALRVICEMPEEDFGEAFGLTRYAVNQPAPEDFYLFRDNGADVLAVAHLDTVAPSWSRGCHYVETEEAGLVVFSRALDDRLGAYVILDLLPRLGLEYDILLTVGEESGRSTAGFFESPKTYDWMFQFDRGGTDVVMYQYDDSEVRQMVRNAGASVGEGIFSDICYLEHLGVKGFNWGVGYREYHSSRSHAFLDDTFDMVESYLEFHEDNEGTYMPHYPSKDYWYGGGARGLWVEDTDPKWDELKDEYGWVTEDVNLPDDPEEFSDPQDWNGSHWLVRES